jgi:predicted metal-dependent hydrolase
MQRLIASPTRRSPASHKEPAGVDVWSVKLHVMPRAVRVQRMTRKWGSCSTAGTVTLAIDLDEEGEGFQDFVIAHELKVPNHGRLFKALMTGHVPGWLRFDLTRRQKLANYS